MGRVSPPTEEGSGEGAVPPPQKNFRFLSSKRRVLVPVTASWFIKVNRTLCKLIPIFDYIFLTFLLSFAGRTQNLSAGRRLDSTALDYVEIFFLQQ